MSSLFKTFETDKKKEAEGAEIKYAANDDGTIPTFRVARRSTSNLKYRKALENQTRPYRRLIELNSLDPVTDRKIMVGVFCSVILLGWENVQDNKGQAIAYSYDNAISLFNVLPDLYEDLTVQASNIANFKDMTLETDVKN